MERKQIYIAEDNEPLREMLSEIISEVFKEYAIESFSNGAELSNKLKKENSIVRLVLTDNDMPFINGIELVEKYSKKYPEISFILMSGNRGIGKYAIEAGAREFIEKPFKFNEIFDKLKKYL